MEYVKSVIDLKKFINIWHCGQDHLNTEDFRKDRNGGSCPLKTWASRSKRESWNICVVPCKSGMEDGLNLISFKWSPQKQPSRDVLRKRCSENMSKFTGEHPSRSVISIKLLCNFIEITLRHGCSLANLLHIFITPFTKNASGWLLLSSPNFASNIKLI